MAQVLFIYTGQLAAAVGLSEEVIDLAAEATLLGAIVGLAEAHGPRFRELVLSPSGTVLKATLLVALDGVQVTGDRESQTLAGARTVMLMTPIAGG